MNMHSNRDQPISPVGALVLGAIGVLSFLALSVLDRDTAIGIAQEDRLVEYATALFFLAAFLVCLYRIVIAGQRREPLLYLWLVLSFLFLGEEVSWFQRIFNYSLPGIESINAQGEVNLHNLQPLQHKEVPGEDPRDVLTNPLARVFMLDAAGAFRMGYLFYFLVLPVLVALGPLKGLARRLHYRVPSAAFLAAIWVTVAVSVLLQPWYDPLGLRRTLAEMREMYLAFFIFAYVYAYLRYSPAAAPSERVVRTSSA